MPTLRRRHLAALALAPALARPALAQAPFPSRQVRIVVPFPAGGAADILTRSVSEPLRQAWRQTIVVENVSGAGGNVGAAAFARAEPDGHTLLSSPPGPLTINQFLNRSLNFDPMGFVPLTVLAKVPNVVAVGLHTGITSVAQLAERARARPATMTFASQGNGSTSHLTGAMFQSLTGTSLVHVPYRGEAPALTDLVSGQVDMMFGNVTAALPHHASGRIRIIAVTDEARSSLLPEVPTAAEAGMRGFLSAAWFAMVAPAGTPAPLAERISAQVAEALAAPSLRDRYRDLGAEPVGRPPAETAAFFAEERTRWSEVIRFANVTAD